MGLFADLLSCRQDEPKSLHLHKHMSQEQVLGVSLANNIPAPENGTKQQKLLMQTVTGKILNREMENMVDRFPYRKQISFSSSELVLIHPKKTLSMCNLF